MSKSASEKGDIFLVDSLKTIEKKIMSAVTDSGSEIRVDATHKPGITNLLTIYAALQDVSIEEAALTFKDYRYGDFKKAVAVTVLTALGPLKARAEAFLASGVVDEVLKAGAEKASVIANKTLVKVKKAVGLL